jgi:predicted transposase/invertase (TIGR01784 family)
MISIAGERVNPLSDFIFLKALGERGAEPELKAFLGEILKKTGRYPISHLELVSKHLIPSEIRRGKSCVLDIHAAVDGASADIEVQLGNQGDLVRRMLFYASRLYTINSAAGEKYQDFPDVIVISIIDFEVSSSPNFHNTYHFRNDDTGELFSGVIELHVIEMPKFRRLAKKDMNNPLHQWLMFFDEHTDEFTLKNIIDMNTEIKETNKRIMHAVSTPEALTWFYDKKAAEWNYNTDMANAKEQGKEEGVGIGKELGKEIGKIETRNENILNFFQLGIPVEKIAEGVKLPLSEVLAITSNANRQYSFAQ